MTLLECYIYIYLKTSDFKMMNNWSWNDNCTHPCILLCLQAAQHPFVTEEPYYGPYVPLPETPRTVSISFSWSRGTFDFVHFRSASFVCNYGIEAVWFSEHCWWYLPCIYALQPVHQGLLMEHRGIAGHWFCAGLSPQVDLVILDIPSHVYLWSDAHYTHVPSISN